MGGLSLDKEIERRIVAERAAQPKFEMRMGFPPCYEAALARFPVIKGRPLIFAYAPYIYCVNRARCGPEKVAHETIHLIRQGTDPAAWWARYLSDDAFRSEEEVLAHVAGIPVLV